MSKGGRLSAHKIELKSDVLAQFVAEHCVLCTALREIILPTES